ncbi:MAG: type II secretion system major pseudopilin GspG [Pseudomonadota bacterium]
MLSFPLSFPSTRSRFSRRRRARSTGFSLVEMLVAVAIVGLLVGLVGPAAMRQLQSSRVKATEAQIAQLRSAVDIFLIDTGRYPSAGEGLNALVQNPLNVPGWNGPYLRDGQMPTDPWGGPFRYSLDAGGQVRIMSLGADGQPGGTGLNADIAG